ncbi:hypothetical protein SAMN05877753_1114 [Bacillus oleivorans]|uniref:Uncharacterized protein n=1 Tax=Bacillus oleivorans TaxID=1448271 RepID=A0A285D769_9BACI|nr:hypothetical protein SAMN05877753_1114 [Bacillus oleivorans]
MFMSPMQPVGSGILSGIRIESLLNRRAFDFSQVDALPIHNIAINLVLLTVITLFIVTVFVILFRAIKLPSSVFNSIVGFLTVIVLWIIIFIR